MKGYICHMSFKGKMKQGRYALLTAAVLARLGAMHGHAAEDAGVGSDKSNFAEGIHVDVDFDKEMLKNAPLYQDDHSRCRSRSQEAA